MAQYDVPTPNTLLFRAVSGDLAAAALRLLEAYGPADDALSGPVRVFTLTDVVSEPGVMPVAACTVARPPDSPAAWIDRFVVALPFRRRGLGARLLAETVTALRADGVDRLFVRVTPGDELTPRLLARTGLTSGSVMSGSQSCSGWSEGQGADEHGQPWSWRGHGL